MLGKNVVLSGAKFAKRVEGKFCIYTEAKTTLTPYRVTNIFLL